MEKTLTVLVEFNNSDCYKFENVIGVDISKTIDMYYMMGCEVDNKTKEVLETKDIKRIEITEF